MHTDTIKEHKKGILYAVFACCTGQLVLLKMYLWGSLCTLYFHACQVRVTIGDSRLGCVCVTSFERCLIPCLLILSFLCVVSVCSWLED